MSLSVRLGTAGRTPWWSFLKERLLSRQRSSKRSTMLEGVDAPRPDCDRAPSRRRGQGRQSRRREASTLPKRGGACWRWSRGLRRSSRPLGRGKGHEVSSPGPKRASGGQVANAVACHSCAGDREIGMECCGTTRRGQSDSRPRRRTGGHDHGRPRAWWCPFRVTPPR